MKRKARIRAYWDGFVIQVKEGLFWHDLLYYDDLNEAMRNYDILMKRYINNNE